MKKITDITIKEFYVLLLGILNLYLIFYLFPSIKSFSYSLAYTQEVIVWVGTILYTAVNFLAFINFYSCGVYLVNSVINPAKDESTLEDFKNDKNNMPYLLSMFARTMLCFILIYIGEILVAIISNYY